MKHGYAFKGEHFASEGEEIVLTPGNFPIGGGLRFREGKERYYTGSYPPEFRLSPGDLLMVLTDLTQDAPILGSPALIPDRPTVLHNQRLGLVSINDNVELDLRFLYYLLSSDASRSQLRATATGSTVRHTAPERIYRVQVGVPPLAEQRTISSILGALDDLIGNSRRRVGVLEEMARAIYREWFVHFRYPGHEGVAIVDSPLGPIPQGWRLSTCGDELTALGGGTPSKKEPSYWDGGTVPWFTPSDLTKSRSRFTAEPELCITEEGVARSSARRFPVGSVLMTSRATLGVLAIATTEATTNQGFIVILPDDRWAPGFIYEWLEAHADELTSVATGATFKEITKGAFKGVPFLVPAQTILDAHRERIAAIEQQIHTLEQATVNLAVLRDVLLPRLVTGRIDVSSLDLEALMEGSEA